MPISRSTAPLRVARCGWLDLVVPEHHRLATREAGDLQAVEQKTWILPRRPPGAS